MEIGDFTIDKSSNKVFIIAEIGQNHQGNLDIAKKMIIAAKECGCDCVKFQKSCLSSKFSKAALDRPYNNNNSWGSTYGQHKEFLEFSYDEYKLLQSFSNEHGIMFTASAMDEDSLDFLLSLTPPFIKIGSGDANNFLLLDKAAQVSVPLIISTGMQTIETIKKIIQIMESHKKTNFALLHCISAYPVRPECAALNLINNVLRKEFPNIVIGYSGHEEGHLISQTAVLLGAKIIERHFTLDKNQKGSDHQSSLNPTEFRNFILAIRKMEEIFDLNKISRNINEILEILKMEYVLDEQDEENIRKSMSKKFNERKIFPCELNCRMKLGKSICYSRNLKVDDIIQKNDLSIKVTEPFGISAEYCEEFLGKKLKTNVTKDENISNEHFC